MSQQWTWTSQQWTTQEGADAASAETDEDGREMKEDAYLSALRLVKEAQANGMVNKQVLKQAFAALKK